MNQLWEDVRVEAVVGGHDRVADDVLYDIELELSAPPPAEWVELFIAAWEEPSVFKTLHRPGICHVRGDRVTLADTTHGELLEHHFTTVQRAVMAANRGYRYLLDSAAVPGSSAAES